MMSSRYLEELAKALSRATIPEFSAGASGYFSKPQKILDPALFEGDYLKPGIGFSIMSTLFMFWRKKGYNVHEWATVWLAGSGISYQWAGDRGNGDLDALIGIDWPKFYLENPQWAQTSIEETTAWIDQELRNELWPSTAHTEFGGKQFELTYYVNLNATDIRDIHPYAAYNLSTDSWTVRPPAAHDTAYYHPGDASWLPYADRDLETAQNLVQELMHYLSHRPDTKGPDWVSGMQRIAVLVNKAVQLMTDIHGSRHLAFAPGGQGYWDFNNWRWQMAKKNGIVAVLGALEAAHKEADEAAQRDLYSEVLPAADIITTRAALGYRDRT